MATKTFRVESENWAYFINLETEYYEKTRDMAIEAMTRALEAYMDGKYKDFVTDGDGEGLKFIEMTVVPLGCSTTGTIF